MALYRKYRPATFAEVVGQEHVTEPLSTALEAGRINHAYLFSGPRGCGKTSSARILARSLNCAQGPTATPCGVCSSCVALAPGGPGNLDVTELDAASHGGVDDTRELRDRAFYAPAESRYRIFIVDEAHMVTTAGFNALLKIVEEPPEHLIFVFATTEPEKVLPTIRSRTHHYPFRLLAPATMKSLLQKICVQEQIAVDEAVYPLVIRAGGGSPRDSLSVLDQLLAGAGEEGVTYQRALALLGVTDIALIDTAVEALGTGNGAELFGAVESVMEAGHDPRRFAVDLLERIRDLILIQAVPDAMERGLVEAPGDVMERMRAQAVSIGPASLARYAEIIHAGLGEMRGATAPRLLLEVVCARMLLPAASDAESAVLQRIEQLERRVDAGVVAPVQAASKVASSEPSSPVSQEVKPAVDVKFTRPSRQPQEPSKAEPEPISVSVPTTAEVASPEVEEVLQPPVQAVEISESAPLSNSGTAAENGVNLVVVQKSWPQVQKAVRERSKTTEVMLSGATVLRIDGATLILHHDSAPLAKRLSEPRNADVVSAALKEVFEVSWQVICESGRQSTTARPAVLKTLPDSEKITAPQKFSRPSRTAEREQISRPSTPESDIPVPEEPEPYYPETEFNQVGAREFSVVSADDEEEMLQEAASESGEPQDRRDPEEVALELLQAELGARPIDGS
ncbi:MAG: DNA polymerase III subunits gamma/tau [Mycobacteriaceae bacterium]